MAAGSEAVKPAASRASLTDSRLKSFAIIDMRSGGSCLRGKRAARVGEWLSLVEHLVRDQGVGGSNPLSPTNKPKWLIELALKPILQFPKVGSDWVR